MLRIAITGGIACGKSTAGRYFSLEGVPVLEADETAHELLEPGSDVYREVVGAFGREILGPSERIDRRKLGEMVFGDTHRMARLNSIIHPRVKEKWETWLHSLDGCVGMAGVIIPLLFEAKMALGWDSIICIAASRETQISRLRQRGIVGKEAQQRLKAQMDVEEKMRLSEYVVWNEGSESVLAGQVGRVLSRVMEKV